jgi:hypothetical protein
MKEIIGPEAGNPILAGPRAFLVPKETCSGARH